MGGWRVRALVAGAALLAASAVQPVRGQTLSGRIETLEGMPLSDVLVTLARQTDAGRLNPEVQRTATLPDGRFGFTVVVDGDYRLQAERVGFTTYTSAPIALRVGDPVTVRLVLQVEPVLLEPLEVTASRRPWWEVLQPPGLWPFFDRMARYERAGRGRFFSGREVEVWRGIPVTHALSALLPYLRAEPAPGRPGQALLRGPGRCEPLVFIDGLYVDLTPTDSRGNVIDRIPLEFVLDPFSVVAVESYRGMSQAPVELTTARDRADPNCTVLGIWTRRR